MNRKHGSHSRDGQPLRHCAVDYVGITTNLYFFISDSPTNEEEVEVTRQCQYIEDESQCITYLNQRNIRAGEIYCCRCKVKAYLRDNG